MLDIARRQFPWVLKSTPPFLTSSMDWCDTDFLQIPLCSQPSPEDCRPASGLAPKLDSPLSGETKCTMIQGACTNTTFIR